MLNFCDLHLHTEYSLKDGMIRFIDHDEPSKKQEELVLHAIKRGTGVLTATDHGNMYAHAEMAYVADAFDLKHIPACEFYIARGNTSRLDRDGVTRSEAYDHINAWAINKEGYRNLCILQKYAYTDGFYYVPRIDRELVEKYNSGIIWSDACMGGTISSVILDGKPEQAYEDFKWYLNLLKDRFVVEYQNHYIPTEESANQIKIEWCKKHGVPVIATTDAHFTRKEDEVEAHKMLLSIQYVRKMNDPLFSGFPGSGYWLMDETELLERYPKEYLENTMIIPNMVKEKIVDFGNIIVPSFKIPDWFQKL